MSFRRRTTQLLHEDHQATIVVVEALDQLLARARKSKPDVTDKKVEQALTMAATAIEDEINTHFHFEEDELFTLLKKPVTSASACIFARNIAPFFLWEPQWLRGRRTRWKTVLAMTAGRNSAQPPPN